MEKKEEGSQYKKKGLIKLCSVTYPLETIFRRYLYIPVGHLIIAYNTFGLQFIRETVVILAWSIIYYFFTQYSYRKVDIYFDRIIISYPISFYVKEQEYLFIDIEMVFIQFNVGYRSTQFFVLCLKNKKNKKVAMPTQELSQIRYHLMGTNLRIVNGKNSYDRVEKYL